MKKIIVIILVATCVGMGFWTFKSLQQKAFQTKSPIEVIPLNAAIIIESNNIRSAWSRLAETNLVYDAALNNSSFHKLNETIRLVDSLLNTKESTANLLDQKPTVLSLHSGDGVQFFLATNGSQRTTLEIGSILSQFGTKKETTISEIKVHQFTINNDNYFLAHLDPFILFTTDASLIGNSISQIKDQSSLLDNAEFKELRKSKNSNLGLQVFVNGPKTGSLFSKYLNKNIAENWQGNKILPTWSVFDINEKSNALIINGLSTSDGLNQFFRNTKSQKTNASKSLWLLPTDLLSFKRASISNPTAFIQENSIADMTKESSICECDPEVIFSDWIKDEVVSISFGENNNVDYAYLIGCSGNSNLSGKLSTFGVSDTVYKNIYNSDIYTIKDHSFLKILGINDTTHKIFYFSRMNDFAVFSTFNGVAKIAYQWKASQASVPNNMFINFSQKLMANYSTNDVYYSANNALNALLNIVKPEYHNTIIGLKTDLEKINGVIWQSSDAKNNFTYHSVAINTNEGNEQVGAVQKLWNLSMQKNIVGSPQVMKNHQTGTNEIIVQDESNTLHLIGATGKVKWFKNINEPIIGDVTQIDLYNNGKYQMLFNTATKIHLLDINGNEVSGYPIKLPSNATNQVAVFDYDKNGDYRILVSTLDKRILNYSKDGKSVTGWLAPNTKSIILNTIEHFVMEGKDYICAHDINGNIYLLNRKGEIRQEVVNKLNAVHKEQIYLQLGTSLATTKFIFQDSTERIVEMPIEGPSKTFELDSTMYDFHQYTADIDNDKLPEFIVSFGNKFSVYGPDKAIAYQELYDFDIHQNLKSIGENSKYTIIGDQNKGKIYLFNHQFKPVQGFPQNGTINATIGDLNKDGNIEVITVINGNQIVTYSINQLYGI